MVVTELPYENGDDNFRPDIVVLINGMPLSFVEVKGQNNREGILAERERMTRRFSNPGDRLQNEILEQLKKVKYE